MPNQNYELQKPVARTEGLLYTRLKDELVIYDMQRNKAHSLNCAATLIWEHCDGQTSVQQLSEMLSHELPERVDEQVVWLALRHLEKNHLLQERVGMPSNVISRREAARRFGKITAIVLPIIMTTVVPPAMAESSCIAAGQPSPGAEQCCTRRWDSQTGLCTE